MTPAPNATRAAGEPLPCPFCNGESDRSGNRDAAFVECLKCGAFGPPAIVSDVAVTLWNQRAPLAPAVVDAGTLARLANWRMLADAYTDIEHGGIAACLRQACDALATAAQPARAVPDRAAVEAALAATYRHGADVAQSAEGDEAATEWANGVIWAVAEIQRAFGHDADAPADASENGGGA